MDKKSLYIGDNEVCYAIGEPGFYNLLVVGLSPNDETLDNPGPLIKRIRKITTDNQFEGWMMVNLYPVNISDGDDLPEAMDSSISDNNIEVIRNLQNDYEIGRVYAIWGDDIENRDYLAEECKKISDSLDESVNWYIRGRTRYGNPKNPLKVTYEEEFNWFPLIDYLSSFDVIY